MEGLSEFVSGLEKPKPIFDHDFFKKAQSELELSDRATILLGSMIREEAGRHSIEPGLEFVIKSYGKDSTDKFFSVEEVIMQVKDPDSKEYVEQKRFLVYCNDIEKVNPSLEVKVLFKNQFFKYTLWKFLIEMRFGSTLIEFE